MEREAVSSPSVAPFSAQGRTRSRSGPVLVNLQFNVADGHGQFLRSLVLFIALRQKSSMYCMRNWLRSTYEYLRTLVGYFFLFRVC